MGAAAKVVGTIAGLGIVFGAVAGVNDIIHNGLDGSYSSGVRAVTQVQKESFKGVFDKSCEVQLETPGSVENSSGNGSSNIWPASVLDPGAARALSNAQKNDNNLVVQYKQFLPGFSPYRLKTDYVVVAVSATSGPDRAAASYPSSVNPKTSTFGSDAPVSSAVNAQTAAACRPAAINF